MKNDKYEMIKEREGKYMIKALKDFGNIEKGDMGGFIEKESNLSVSGNAWVYDNACVYGDACVSGNACVYGDARVYGDAFVYGDAVVYGNARVSGTASVSGKIKLEFGWCFGRKQKDWKVTELENEDSILLIKDYKPSLKDEAKELTVAEISEKLGYDVKIVKEKHE